MADRLNLNFEQMLEAFDRGIIGTREFRSWLETNSASFAVVRDRDVDQDIEDRAAYAREEFEAWKRANRLALDNGDDG